MQTIISKSLFLFLLWMPLLGFSQEIQWLNWEEAVQLQESEPNPKKMFIDVYTDWCRWCKVMDKETFQNPEVAAYMNATFYMVKLDAEGKETITYKGQDFNFVASGRNGYHELAAGLLQGQLSYPTVVFLDEKQQMLSPVPGYQKADDFLKIAKFFGDEIYKNKDWKTYSSGQ
jgi:thioredoxin-related protein